MPKARPNRATTRSPRRRPRKAANGPVRSVGRASRGARSQTRPRCRVRVGRIDLDSRGQPPSPRKAGREGSPTGVGPWSVASQYRGSLAERCSLVRPAERCQSREGGESERGRAGLGRKLHGAGARERRVVGDGRVHDRGLGAGQQVVEDAPPRPVPGRKPAPARKEGTALKTRSTASSSGDGRASMIVTSRPAAMRRG